MIFKNIFYCKFQKYFKYNYLNFEALSIYNIDPRTLGLKETPEERLNRIKLDLLDLKEEIKFIQEKGQQNKHLTQNEQGSILRDIEMLESELAKVSNSEGFQNLLTPGTLNKFSDSNNLGLLKLNIQNELSEKIFNNIKDLSSTREYKQNSFFGKDNNIKLELYLNKKQEDLKLISKQHDLERRLTNIEKLVGSNQVGSEFDMVEKVQKLEKISIAMDSEEIEELSRKLQFVKIEMDSLISLKERQNINEDRTKKINELYNGLKNSQNTLSAIPNIVQRLECLQNLHEDSASIAKSINNLHSVHDQIKSSLDANQKLLEIAQNNFSKNYETIQKNIKLLDDKIKSKK